MRVDRPIVASGLTAGVLALAMLAVSLATGATQEWFEVVHPADAYAARLLARPGALRLLFTLDDVFLVAYAAFFACIAAERRGSAPAALVAVMLGGMLGTAALDMLENHHILAMLAAAEQGRPPGDAAIAFQAIASGVKFHLSYVAAVALGVVFPRDGALARVVAIGVGVFYPVLGAVIFTAPPPWSDVLSLARAAFFVAGFVLTAIVYARRAAAEEAAGSLEPAP